MGGGFWVVGFGCGAGFKDYGCMELLNSSALAEYFEEHEAEKVRVVGFRGWMWG